jgi:response regulator RpfG family c-di-GMP phosphodiesterase
MCSLNEDEAWNVLIVDDEPEIHVLTKTVLKGVVFEDKPINFLSSYDAPGTKEILAGDTNIALVLMDVVMEEPHTGLDLVRHIREDLNNRLTRIILRTGQPGEAPERKIIAEYEINDYKEKIDLTSNRLFTSVVKSIRNYRDLKTIKDINEELEKSREGLTRMLRTSSGLFGLRSLESFHSELVKEAAVMMGRYGSMMLTGAGLETIVRAEGTWKDSIGAPVSDIVPGNILKTVPDEFGSSTILLKEGFLFGRLTSVQGPVLYLISGVKQSPDEGEIRLLEIFLGNANIVYNNLSLEADFQATQSEMIGLLGDVIENRSQELQGHVSRVSEYAVFLARKAGISEEDLMVLKDAVPMHDIGKIGIVDAILQKPGPLTTEEFETMKEHTTIGYEILRFSSRKLFQMAAIIAREHHERWDGKGYPNGLAFEEIHQLGRITCIVDVFDALSSDRVYRKAWDFAKTVRFIRDGRGTQFDPELVDLFFEEPDLIKEIMVRHAD